MTIIKILLLLSSVYLLGWQILRPFGLRMMIEKISLAFLVGTSISTMIFFILFSFVRLPFNQLLILEVFSLVWISWFIQTRILKTEFWDPFLSPLLYLKKIKLRKLEIIMLAVLGFILISSLLSNLYWPIVDWDALALYDFRAKVLIHDGNFDNGLQLGYFFQYPPFTSILHALTYGVGVIYSKIWYSLLYFCFLLSFYQILRQRSKRIISIIGTIILATTPALLVHAKMAYTNLPYTIYLGLGFLYLLSWIKTGQRYQLFVGAVLIATSTWIRMTEPFWLLSTVFFLIGLGRYRKQWLIIMLSGLLIVFFKQPWMLYISQLQGADAASLANSVPPADIKTSLSLSQLYDRFKQVSLFLSTTLRGTLSPYILAILLSFYSTIFKRKYYHLLDFGLFVILLLSIFAGTYVFSFRFPEWTSIPDSATRMSMFLYPLMIYLIMISDFWNFEYQNK